MLDINYEVTTVTTSTAKATFIGEDKDVFFERLAVAILKQYNEELSLDNIERFKLYAERMLSVRLSNGFIMYILFLIKLLCIMVLIHQEEVMKNILIKSEKRNFTTEELTEVGQYFASLWRAECYDFSEVKGEDSYVFFCLEHGERFVFKLTHEEILKNIIA